MGRKARLECVLDCEEPRALANFWRQVLDYRSLYSKAHLVVLVPKEGTASPLLLQKVPERKVGKNRMHLDIVVDDIETEVRRLQELGAHRIDEGVQSLGEPSGPACRTPSRMSSACPPASNGNGHTTPTPGLLNCPRTDRLQQRFRVIGT
jgi:Glyoxalase-like domain